MLALLIAFPAAYILARRNFRGKTLLLLLYFLPLVIPQMTYGIPLATTLYGWPIGGTIVGVILAILVPMVPLAIFVLIPFFEQISLNLEWGAQTLGASRAQIFRRILLPLMVPGMLTAGVLILVNTISNFELTFLRLRRRLADAGRRAVLQRVRRRRAAGLLGRCHGADVHGDRAGDPARRAALRAPDPDGVPAGSGGAVAHARTESSRAPHARLIVAGRLTPLRAAVALGRNKSGGIMATGIGGQTKRPTQEEILASPRSLSRCRQHAVDGVEVSRRRGEDPL